MECPKCGFAMGPFDEECPRCKRQAQQVPPPGTPVVSAEDTTPTNAMHCPHCGGELLAEPGKQEPPPFCGQCGKATRQAASTAPVSKPAPLAVTCSIVLLVLVIGTVVLVIGRPKPKPKIDLNLTPVRQAIEYEISGNYAVGAPLRYRLHSLEMTDNGWLSVVLDLQSVPASKTQLVQDASNWAAYVGLVQVDGKYVQDIVEKQVRVSIWTVTSEDNVLPWGAYRLLSGSWDPGPGYENFDALTR